MVSKIKNLRLLLLGCLIVVSIYLTNLSGSNKITSILSLLGVEIGDTKAGDSVFIGDTDSNMPTVTNMSLKTLVTNKNVTMSPKMSSVSSVSPKSGPSDLGTSLISKGLGVGDVVVSDNSQNSAKLISTSPIVSSTPIVSMPIIVSPSINVSPSAQPSIVPTPTQTTTPMPTQSKAPISFQNFPTGSVVMSEISWMGTSSSFTDEWVEIYNNTDSEIDLSGWSIRSETDSSPDILLSGKIRSQSFFLIERTNDEVIADVKADLVASFGKGGLLNSGEVLVLSDPSGKVHDLVGINGQNWYAGDNEIKATMEKINYLDFSNSSTNWATNNGQKINGKDAQGSGILGTPRSLNSVSN